MKQDEELNHYLNQSWQECVQQGYRDVQKYLDAKIEANKKELLKSASDLFDQHIYVGVAQYTNYIEVAGKKDFLTALKTKLDNESTTNR